MSAHRPRKRFGQHFLVDIGVIAQLVDAIAPRSTDHFVEVGPGQGVLTQPLIDSGAAVEAIELDRDLVPVLAERWSANPRFRVHQGDVLKFDFSTLGEGLRLVGNLPYNISTPLLFLVLEQTGRFEDMHFMLQKEVVARLTASPGSKAYGRLSVMTALLCQAEAVFEVGPEAFSPPPKVDSAVVRLLPHARPILSGERRVAFGDLVRSAFAQRRKTLRNNLRGIIEADAMQAIDIDPGRRAETLSLEEFLMLNEL